MILPSDIDKEPPIFRLWLVFYGHHGQKNFAIPYLERLQERRRAEGDGTVVPALDDRAIGDDESMSFVFQR